MNGIQQKRIALLVFGATLMVPSAFAQIDLAGMWAPRAHQDWMERNPGPDPVDYLGLPINDAARENALLFNYSVMSQPEHQCGYYTPFYNATGPQGLKIWSENDPVRGNRIVAWKISGFIDIDVTTIWMDGRPHPSKNSFHPYSGFTTGIWEGDVLTTYTTHMKTGWIRRNGTPSSDQATMIQHIFRHGNFLTIMTRLDDPVYLTEPYVVSRVWQLDPRNNIPATSAACEPIAEVPRFDVTSVVPHYMSGKNPFVNEVPGFYNIPLEAVMGGAETMYPEYRKRLKDKYVRPNKCVRYCGQDASLGLLTDGSGKPGITQ